jgi:hypothetical protein
LAYIQRGFFLKALQNDCDKLLALKFIFNSESGKQLPKGEA